MKTKLLIYSATTAALIAASGPMYNVQAQSTNTTPAPAAPAASSISVLEDAYATLEQAKHDYNGHRGEAMEQLKLAAKELGGHLTGKGKKHESKSEADAQLKAAQNLLKQLVPNLKDKPLMHVNKAIKQIDAALAKH